MKEAVIVSGARTAVGRAPKGTLRGTHPADMTAACITEALERANGLDPADVEDVIIGCAMPEGTQGYNISRQSLLRAGLPESVPGQTVNRFCSSGLQTIAAAAERIMAGYATTIISGGVEHMSTTLEMPNFSPNPTLVETNPAVYMGMGLTAEEVANEFDVSREDQDEFALRSHDLAREAVESGRFDEEIVPIDVKLDWVDENGEPQHLETTFQRDEGPRDTSQEKLAKLPTVFRQDGTVTAGNSSQRSDGAAAVVVMEREEADGRHGHQAHRPAHERDEAPGLEVRHGHHVHRRRHGRRGNLREPAKLAVSFRLSAVSFSGWPLALWEGSWQRELRERIRVEPPVPLRQQPQDPLRPPRRGPAPGAIARLARVLAYVAQEHPAACRGL